MNKGTISLVVGSLMMVLLATSTYGQIGFGAGLAGTGEDVLKAGGELENLLTSNGEDVTYDDISGEIGPYGMIGAKIPISGGLRITGELDYIYIQNSELKLTSFDINDDTSFTATFEVGTSLIPVSAGIEYAIPLSTIRPYVGLYPIYTFVNRTYTVIEGDQVAGIENASAGENEFGAGLEAGIELSLPGPFTLGLRARYSVANMFSAGEGEGTFGVFQLGASLWIGSIVKSDNDDEEGGGDSSSDQ